MVTKSEAIELVLDGKLVVANAVSKLYKKELFENVRYPKGKIAEDAAVILKIINQCNKIHVDTSQNIIIIIVEIVLLVKNLQKKILI